MELRILFIPTTPCEHIQVAHFEVTAWSEKLGTKKLGSNNSLIGMRESIQCSHYA